MNLENNQKILIFDTNIFLTGIDFNLINGIIYTTPKVINEINVDKFKEKNRNILHRIQAGIDSKKLILKNAAKKYIYEIHEISKITGDLKALSFTDIELLALALELSKTKTKDIIIYTNDYSMENMCKSIGLSFSPLYKEGIKSTIKWEVYCPQCKQVYKSEEFNNFCDKCGLKLKRRMKRS